MMTLEHPLDEESRAFLAAVEEFARKEVAPHADQWDHDEKLPREIFRKAGKIGLMGMVVPKEYGGRGLSYVTAALAIMELGAGTSRLYRWTSLRTTRSRLARSTSTARRNKNAATSRA
jgi:alkylation response protein AidB-like acyl-CoA dehydrogenase